MIKVIKKLMQPLLVSHADPMYEATKPSRRCTVGVVQVCSTSDIEANYEKAKHYIIECVSKGSKLICLPECFAFMGDEKVDSNDIKETLSGPILEKYCSLAKEYKAWLSLGGFQEKIESSPKRYSELLSSL